MPDLKQVVRNPRVKIYGALVLLLAGAITLLIVVRSNRPSRASAPNPMHFQILDEAGVPIRQVAVYVKRRQGEISMQGAKFNEQNGTLTLQAQDHGATVLLAAKGYRIKRLDNVQAGAALILRKGLRIRLQVTGDAPPMEPPLIGLFRIRPTPATAKLAQLDDETRIDLDLADHMRVLYRNRPNVKPMSVARFGFAISEDDAGSGMMLPTAGTYEVRWGLLDEGVNPKVWWTLPDGPRAIITVPEEGEGMVFDIKISRSTWARTRAGLRQQIERMLATPR